MSGEISRVSHGPNASTVQAVIFDLNFGYHVPRARILPEIGKGGDKLVPSILGEDSDEHEREALHEAHGRHYMTIAKDTIFRVFPGTEDLLGELTNVARSGPCTMRNTPPLLVASHSARRSDAERDSNPD
jgi:phosphoglycolate phosphatase-like HAD superfamily hydrolase